MKIKIFGITIEYRKRLLAGNVVTLEVTVIALSSAFFFTALLFLMYGKDPILAISSILYWAFVSPSGFSFTLTRAIPLLLCGAGLAIALKASFWNIGAEGQLLMGAIAATWIALFVNGIPGPLVLPTMFIMSFIFGAFWALIPAFLRVKFEANEIIVTLMLNYVATNLVNYLIYGPWRGKSVYNFPFTDIFPPFAWEPKIPGTSIYVFSLIIAFSSALFLYYLLERTTLGYEIKVVGGSREAAKYAGIDYKKTILLIALISGGLSGVAGAGLLSGIHHRLQSPTAISPGYGNIAILVAWLARLNPLIAIFTAIFMSGISVGSQQIQIVLELPAAVMNIFNGVILFFIVGFELLRKYEVKIYFGKD
ncbi:MAG: ABC transporter permease [Candidatus Asgardarchaeia archaeon]